MQNTIQTKYDEGIKGYIVEMPKFISLTSIQAWTDEFNIELNAVPAGQQITMLINTNEHDFESIQCLKILREFFESNQIIQSSTVKAAFVGPKRYMQPHQSSEFEAYFESSKEAYKWLES